MHPRAPADAQLRRMLAHVLACAGIGELLDLQRIEVPQRSTFPLERVNVRLRDGGRMQIAFKRLEWSGLSADARLSKPAFTFEAAREPAVYASLLPHAPGGPPRFLGSLPSNDRSGRWLFLEWVQGRELHQIGSIASWGEAARWLGQLHVALAGDRERHADEAGLLRHDAAYCKRWAMRASEFARGDGDGARSRFLRLLLRRYDAVVEELLGLPQTVIHGDFYASNVLVCERPGEVGEALSGKARPAGVRVAPVDWEMAAVGSGLMDLVALTSGDWSEAERETMCAAYAEVEGVPSFSARQLDLVRLHHAVQRLGWASPGWSAPQSQRHDWLAEAMMLADALELSDAK